MLGAVDIGGTKIAVGLVTTTGELIDSVFLPTLPEQIYSAAVKQVITTLEDLVRQHQVLLTGIGLGATGRIRPNGAFQANAFLPSWSGHTPASDIAAYFGVAPAIENDADAAALAELYWGAGSGVERFIYVTVSTGIGGGIVLHGKVYRGVDGCHPEIGHHMIEPEGPACFCGAHGCWETMASGTALAMWARANGGMPEWDARTVCDLAEQGNLVARRAVVREARYLGIGLANLMTIFAPDCIVLGGGLMQRWELFRENVETVIAQNCGLVPWQRTRLAVSALPHPGLQGAAAAWFHHHGADHDL